jgi:hypothetical protein
MGVVAGAAFPTVGILTLVEIRQNSLHLMAAKTLRPAGHQRTARGIASCQGGDFQYKPMATRAMAHGLPSHPAKHDTSFTRRMAIALAAGLAGGFESVHLGAMTCDALQISQCAGVGLQVNTVPRCGGNALPGSRVTRDVATFTNSVGHFRMQTNCLRAFRDPQVELPRAGEHRLLVAVVTGQRRVSVVSTRETLECRIHDVAPGAEVVRVLRVVPGRGAHASAGHNQQQRGCSKRELHGDAAGRQPRTHRAVVQEKDPETDPGNDGRYDNAPHLYPGRYRIQQKSHDLRDSTGQRGFDDERVGG